VTVDLPAWWLVPTSVVTIGARRSAGVESIESTAPACVRSHAELDTAIRSTYRLRCISRSASVNSSSSDPQTHAVGRQRPKLQNGAQHPVDKVRIR